MLKNRGARVHPEEIKQIKIWSDWVADITNVDDSMHDDNPLFTLT